MTEIRKTEVFARWLDGLNDIRARARILVRIERLAAGNPGDVEPAGERVSELRINYGPGYRVYYKQCGQSLVILPAGGEKHTQAKAGGRLPIFPCVPDTQHIYFEFLDFVTHGDKARREKTPAALLLEVLLHRRPQVYNRLAVYLAHTRLRYPQRLGYFLHVHILMIVK
jgi:putative addiction module killer protein